MAGPALLCTDGSKLSLSALGAGRALLASDTPIAIVAVSEGPDPAEMVGMGHAGPLLSGAEFDRETQAAHVNARATITDAVAALEVPVAATYIVDGQPGPAICKLAAELSAAAIVIGTRGHGGVKRAVLGSVSDYVVRHAPCSVIVTAPSGVS